jgi:hypothetical protein
MEVQDYVDASQILHQTQSSLGGPSKAGSLACTDSRLLFIRNDSVLDIKSDHISEIKYDPNRIRWDYVVGAVLLLVLGAASWFILPEISALPDGLRVFTLLFSALVSLGILGDLYRNYKPTLEVWTHNNKYEFIGGDLFYFTTIIQRG